MQGSYYGCPRHHRTLSSKPAFPIDEEDHAASFVLVALYHTAPYAPERVPELLYPHMF